MERDRRGGGGSKATRVKNKTPAPVQITAEQLLREAQERQEAEIRPIRQAITDPEELADFRMRKRKAFEDRIRRARTQISNWLKYAAFEEAQNDFVRARSVWERALDVEYRNVTLWLKYAEMEMKHKNVNHARNIWDRAVTLLPRVDQLWFKYAYMEEILGNFSGARQIFERWMEWQPADHAWNSYIKFELRHNEIERVEQIFNRYVKAHNTTKAWLKWARFEEKQGDVARARQVYEAALEALGEDANDEKLFISFARLEERAKEHERARTIYKYALDHIPKHLAQDLYSKWIAFEKQTGDQEGIETVILGKRRFQYEEELKINPRNYDIWFDYIHLEENNGDEEKTRDVYERAISNLPPIAEKRFWRRYIYLWINYALYEELVVKDFARAREVYKACLSVIPHKEFTFTKLWIMFAHFEVRQLALDKARLVFGNAIGQCKNAKLFRAYIDLEYQLGNIDRCRILYEKFLEFAPSDCQAWCKFAELESSLEEVDRVRAIFELAIQQPVLDMPEIVWKSYIDFEIEREEHSRARKLYRRLLQRTKHVKVWISFAQFEASLGTDNASKARSVFEEAYNALRTGEATDSSKEERVMIAESWLAFEQSVGDTEKLEEVKKMQPQKIKKRRQVKVSVIFLLFLQCRTINPYT